MCTKAQQQQQQQQQDMHRCCKTPKTCKEVSVLLLLLLLLLLNDTLHTRGKIKLDEKVVKHFAFALFYCVRLVN